MMTYKKPFPTTTLCRQYLPALLLALLLVCTGDVWGCPTCKDGLAHDPVTANMAQGYGMSIVFMMSMPFLILGGLSAYFYWEIRRAQAKLKREQNLKVSAALEVPTDEFDADLMNGPRKSSESRVEEFATTNTP